MQPITLHIYFLKHQQTMERKCDDTCKPQHHMSQVIHKNCIQTIKRHRGLLKIHITITFMFTLKHSTFSCWRDIMFHPYERKCTKLPTTCLARTKTRAKTLATTRTRAKTIWQQVFLIPSSVCKAQIAAFRYLLKSYFTSHIYSNCTAYKQNS